jgi:outer membrane receptor for ferrienterochelin and colicins
MTHRIITTCLAAVCAIPGTTAAYAQSTAAQPPVSDFTLEELLNVEVGTVFGASRYLQRVTDAPAAVSIVTHEEIERFGYQTLAEVLRGVRGFYVTNDRNYSYLGVRGFSRPGDYNTRVLILINGHRHNETIYDGAYVGADFPVPIDLVERVEIIRGPGSSLYGTNALFAVINVVTTSADVHGGVRASVQAGSLGTREAGASFGHRTKSGAEIILGGSAFTADGITDFVVPGYGTARDMDDEQSWKLFGSGVYKNWSLQAAFSSRDKRIPTGAFGIALDDPRSQTNDDRGYVELAYDRAWRGTGVIWKASYDRYAYDGYYAYPEAGGEPAYVSLDTGRADWFTTEMLLTRRVARRHFLTGGVEFRHNFRQDQKAQIEETRDVYFEHDANSRVFAAFLQDELTLLQRLTVTAGVRHDRSGDTGSTNLRLAAIFKPIENSALKMLHGRAFRAPNPYELYYYNQITHSLAPEQVSTTEVVWEHYACRRIRLSASGFYYHARDLITQVPSAEARDGFMFANVANATAPGLEFEAEGAWRGVHVLGSYTFQAAHDGDDVELSNSPRHMSHVRVTGPIVPRLLFYGVEGLAMGDRLTVGGNVAEGTFLGNLTLSSRELRRARLSLSIGNLFDRTYADPGAEEHPGGVILQPGRTVRAALAWRF